MKQKFDANEIRKTIAVMKPNGQLFEVRIIGDNKNKIRSGYFTDAEKMIEQLSWCDLNGVNVYLTLGMINDACYSRKQRDTFVITNNTTSDGDIDAYQWMLVDFDPVRPTGISSSDAELAEAEKLCGEVYEYLKEFGFEEPVKALSGNGYHLLYRIGLSNDDDRKEIVKGCLEALDQMFSNENVKIDTVNFNPARICKLHGTLAQKGSDSEERPHRMSRIISDNSDIKRNDVELLKKLARKAEKKNEPAKKGHTSYSSGTTYSEFNLETFMAKNGLAASHTVRGRDSSIMYCLDECPFDSNHRNGDAKITLYTDGAISFKCHHNSCRHYKWQDVRLKFEPDAYDRTNFDDKYEEGWKQHNRLKEKNIVEFPPEAELEEIKTFRTASEIYSDNEPELEYIRSGVTGIDEAIHGLQKQSISMISGLRGNGKSTVIGNIMLQAIEDSHTVVCYSGELANKKYLNWLSRQAAGRSHVEVSTMYQNGYGVPDDIQQRINAWFGSNFWLYNNKCGNNFKKISTELRKILTEKKADLCVIDNLMALDLTGYSTDEYKAQTQFVWELKELAIQTNTHIVFVAHPRKSNGFMRLDDVSGSGNITNIIDNAFMVHRVNVDFNTKFFDLFKCSPAARGVAEGATNVIEIAKDRENGTMDCFIPLFFEEQTKRLLNKPDEYIHYSWECVNENPFIGE